MEENSIVVIDESGKEINMEIVFTYEDEESGKNYVFYFDPSQEDGEVFVSCYDPEGNLSPVEDPEEWKKLEVIFEDYVLTHEENENTKNFRLELSALTGKTIRKGLELLGIGTVDRM